MHVCIRCSMTKSPFLHSSPTIRPKTAPKMAGMCEVCVKQAQNQERAASWAMCLRNGIPKAAIALATPYILWFSSFSIAKRGA